MTLDGNASLHAPGPSPLITPEIARLVDAQGTGFVASVNDDGTPNLSPKGSIAAIDATHLAFVDLRSPATVANVSVRPTVEVNVVDPLRRRGYRFRGRAEVLREGDAFDAIVARYHARGFTAPIETVVRIRVDRVSPVVSPAYDRGATEDELVRLWAARLGAASAGGGSSDETGLNERALNTLIVAGELPAALECFYEDDVVVYGADGIDLVGRQAAHAHAAALVAARVRLVPRLLGTAARGATTFSEWMYRLELPSGRVFEFARVVVRTWRGDRVALERVFHAPLPEWVAAEICLARGGQSATGDHTL